MPGFIDLLKKMMRHRKRPVHLVIDGLPAHNKACVREVRGIDRREADVAFPSRLHSRSQSG